MPKTRYVIETGTIAGDAWMAGGFHEAINAADPDIALSSVRPALNSMGYRETDGDHVRVLDPEKQEIARLALDEAFWTT
jgi:hypothetical protein